MGGFLKQSTAAVISFGPILDKGDGVTLEIAAGIVTSLDHATTGIWLSKNGGALTVRHQNVTATTYDAHGCFLVTLDTTDTATCGRLRVIHTEPATYLAAWDDFMVVNANVFDSLFAAAATDYLQVDAVQLSSNTAMAERQTHDGMVWVDAGGTNSTAWPYGTATYPTNTIANGKTIADAFSMDQIHVHGALVVAEAMAHYRFIGTGHIGATDLFSTNGQNVSNSVFSHMIVTGATGNTAVAADQSRYVDCLLYVHTNINAVVIDGALGGACSLKDGGYALFSGTFFGEVAACTLTLQAPSQCDIVDMRGTLTLAGMDGGVCSVCMLPGANLTIAASCTAGAITVSGFGTLTDNHAGTCTVTVKEATGDLGSLLTVGQFIALNERP